MTDLPTLSNDSWWAGFKVYVWFSANWNKKVALQMLTVLNSQAHKKWLFWCTSNGWTSRHDYWQFITVITVFVGIIVICSPIYNKNTLAMDHFWCTYDDWILSLVTGQVWTVTKIDKGILLFVKNDNLRNTWCWMHLPFPTPNNKVTWKMDHFSCTSNELLLCLFKIIFEK